MYEYFMIKEKATNFGCNIIKLVTELPKNIAGYAIGNQIIRSDATIGAILTEAANGSTYNDFVYLLRTARKESRETHYWLILIQKTQLLPDTRLIHF